MTDMYFVSKNGLRKNIHSLVVVEDAKLTNFIITDNIFKDNYGYIGTNLYIT